MGKINVLSFAVANLIAAGEVVDRPSSVIKELMENSIDAGADTITVEIQKGGTTFMRVSDNGCGMEPEDLPTALRRHATSKIKNAEDLDAIMSLGFRGEALAAISSVANVRIISKTRDNPMGAMIESHGGNVVGVTERGASDGTTIIVEDLFYNVPARRKFLKKDLTEAMAVSAAVEKIALSHPDIAIRFISDGVLRLETSGDGKALSAIYSVFGRDFAGKMLAVESAGNNIKVSGYIGRSDNVRANRNYQNFFINGRYVKSKTAMAAIEQAYSSYIPPEKFPCCVLFIDIDPRTVDVNVHPAKLEVKFSNEKPVFESIYYAVRNTLEKNITRPEVHLQNGHISAAEYRNMTTGKVSSSKIFASEAPKRQNPISAFVPIEDKSTPKAEQTRYEPTVSSADKFGLTKAFPKTDTASDKTERKAEDLTISIPKVISTESFAKKAEEQVKADSVKAPMPVSEKINDIGRSEVLPGEVKPPKKAAEAPVTEEKKEERTIPPYRIIGEAFNSYIFIDLGEKMLIIDKHAAHERIIFERFKEIMRSREQASQMLMLPIEINLGRDECHALNEYREEIESAGFTFDIGDNKVSVHSSPTGISVDAVPEIFQTFAERLLSGTGNVALTRDLIFEKALYQASCKAAIKAGRQYAEGHTEWLCKKMMEMPDITFCPHGRPVAIEMTKTMLDKQFERL
ncbi:MAG: DNA mismatch repair endonuclease MutL [Clostridia bacterium]|nr:DNA mismatch repair endonuclease MutL [Clostridia bacterium]